MPKILLLLLSILLSHTLSAQTLKKYSIGNSGCSAYIFCDPGQIKMDKSEDSSEVYTAECTIDSVGYGIICVKLNETIESLEDAEGVLIAYMDYLKSTLKIKKSMGYGKGRLLKESENARGVMDYWEDEAGDSFKVTGWATNRHMAVMYVYTKGEVPENKANLFLEGFRFPGM